MIQENITDQIRNNEISRYQEVQRNPKKSCNSNLILYHLDSEVYRKLFSRNSRLVDRVEIEWTKIENLSWGQIYSVNITRELYNYLKIKIWVVPETGKISFDWVQLNNTILFKGIFRQALFLMRFFIFDFSSFYLLFFHLHNLRLSRHSIFSFIDCVFFSKQSFLLEYKMRYKLKVFIHFK